MSYSQHLIPVLLATLLAAAPLRAQPDVAEKNATPVGDGAGETPAASQPPQTPTEAASGSGNAGAGSTSPFDYQASEQISEDLPVSFPVDI